MSFSLCFMGLIESGFLQPCSPHMARGPLKPPKFHAPHCGTLRRKQVSWAGLSGAGRGLAQAVAPLCRAGCCRPLPGPPGLGLPPGVPLWARTLGQQVSVSLS